MRKKVRVVLSLFLTVLCISNVYAYTYADMPTKSSFSINPARSDVYIYQYRTINGIEYRRLWNATKKEWAEPYWTPCP